MSKNKVLFIEPMGAPSNIFAKYMSIPLLGPVYLATMAAKNGYHSEIINENIIKRKVSTQELQDTDVLCISCITATIERGKEIASQYRELRSKTGSPSRVLIGGIHATMLPDELRGYADQIVCGEAEPVFMRLLDGSIGERVVRTEVVEDLDAVPVPDFTLVKNWNKINVWPVMTSRGCPHECRFCSVTKMFGRRYRTQSTERVMDELQHYKNGWVFFVDDNFTAVTSRTHMLLDAMISGRFRRPWTAQVRTDVAKDAALVRTMRRAGCRIVYIGLESINQESLLVMKKRQSIDDIRGAIRTFQKYDIQVHGMFMLGHDPDTKEIFPNTAEFCRKSGLSYVQYSVLTPLPGTEVFADLEREGRLLHKKWHLYDGLHVVFRPANMTAEELQHGMISCFKSFYSYHNALQDCVKACVRMLRKIRKLICVRTNFHAFYPALMKWIGKSIIHKWERQNRPYLAYLCHLTKKT